MKINIIRYIGFFLTVTGLVLLLRQYGFKAWVIGAVISLGSMLELRGVSKE